MYPEKAQGRRAGEIVPAAVRDDAVLPADRESSAVSGPGAGFQFLRQQGCAGIRKSDGCQGLEVAPSRYF